MNRLTRWTELKDTIALFAVWMMTTLVETLFLALWVAVQWLMTTKVIVPLRLAGLDHLVLTVFQVFFAISSLAPVGITIYKDIRLMLLRAQHSIRLEAEVRTRE